MDRYQFTSDNTAAVAPEAWAALAAANAQSVPSYGEDPWTRRGCDLIRQIFETDCEVFFLFNGTAANALALAQICRPFDGVVCFERAHIETDECGAPEFFSGGTKLIKVPAANAKLKVDAIAAALTRYPDLHSPKPRAISITQATEFGTVYTRDELARITEFARSRSLLVHMDGARFANAVAALGCAPKSITWELGVDVLCFGGTKNGTPAGDLVVFFNNELARDFDYRAKQGGQLASKMRFLAAPWVGLLENDVWLRNARRANESAQLLASKLAEVPGVELAFPREASAVFVRLSNVVVRQLHGRGWHFHRFVEPDIYRLMCSWSVTEQEIEEFVADAKEVITTID